MNNKKNTVHASRSLFILCGTAFLVPFMGSAINLALPEIGQVFSMKAVTLTWVATAYLISTAIFQIPCARLADLVGRKKIFLWGIFIFSLTTFLSGFATNGTIFITLRFLSGIGSAMVFGTNLAILTSLFPPEKRGKALGINSAVVYAALAAGPFLGGFLTHYLGWQSIFFACAIAGVIIMVATRFLLIGEWMEAKGERFDALGSVLYGVSLAGIIYGFSTLPGVTGIFCLTGGAVAFVLFIYREKKISFPVLNLNLFAKNRVFTLSSLAALINYAATSAIAFMLSLYLQYVRDLDATHAGLILISQACVQSLFSLLAGAMSNRFAPSKLATLGMSIIVLGLAGLIFLTVETPYLLIILLLVLLGIGFGIFSSPNTNVIMSSVEKKNYTQASAITGTMRLTGQAFSMGIAGMSVSFYIGNQNLSPSNYPDFMFSMRLTFIIFFLLCLLGIYASSARIKPMAEPV